MTTESIKGPPQTELSLRKDLEKLGIMRQMILMVHSSLSSIGWVVGGAITVVRVLLDVIGEDGTLVMSSATPNSGDPADWPNLRVPNEWLEEIRNYLPIFDLKTTPTSMGAIPEAFRTWPGTMRSNHPMESICAQGPLASEVTREHPLAFSEGRGGPFEKLYDLDSWILLIGVGFNRCTALHFAESLVPNRRVMDVRFPLLVNGKRVWFEVQNVADDNDTHFPVIGQKYLSTQGVRIGQIGEAKSMLFPIRSLVDFASRYFEDIL
jgi:aminoglycoside 3-N-acetyltransferase